MEFLRFGSSIPGSYWGCCAADIIQNFKVDPDAKASIQLANGDGGYPITNSNGAVFVGMTYKEIFLQRLRFGTFDKRDMPSHAFIAILTREQIAGGVGQKWMKILKEQGFEFVRTVSNSVYQGASLGAPGDGSANYIFMLVRNIGKGNMNDQFTPPKAWSDLPSVVPEAWQFLNKDGKELTTEVRNAQLKTWNALPPVKELSEKDLDKAGVPVIYSGVRIEHGKQQTREARAACTPKAATAKATKSLSSMIAAA